MREGVPSHVGIVDQLVVDIEVAGWYNLEERFAVEVDLIECRVFLIVDVRVSKAA